MVDWDAGAPRHVQVPPPPTSSDGITTGTVVPEDSQSQRRPSTAPTAGSSAQSQSRDAPPDSSSESRRTMSLLLADLESLIPLKQRAVEVLLAAHKAGGERRAWNARINALSSLLSAAGLREPIKDDLQYALWLAFGECAALDEVQTQARDELMSLREQARCIETSVVMRANAVGMAGEQAMRRLGLGVGVLWEWDNIRRRPW